MLQRITLFLLICMVLSDWYIYAAYIRHLTRRWWLRLLYFLPSLVLLVTLVILVTHEDYSARQTHLTGLFVIVYMAFTIPKGLFCLFSLLGRAFRRLWKPAATVGTASGLFVALSSMAMVLYGTICGWHRYEVKEVSFESVDLPEAFDGYRIVQFSDLHIGTIAGYPRRVQELVDLMNRQQGDLIVFTGDLVNHRATELDGVENILKQLHAPDGVFSVLGNHDYSTYIRWNSPRERAANLEELKQRQARMGWQMLNNAHALIHRGDTCIALIGVENQGYPPFPERGDLPKAMKGTEGMFKVLLSHDPTHWRREVLPDTDIQLMLAGHTHAMQFLLFGFTPASWFYPENRGMYLENERGLYVNIGAGEVMLPFRFGAWPEITVITLHKKQK